jgi:hypothetical protein
MRPRRVYANRSYLDDQDMSRVESVFGRIVQLAMTERYKKALHSRWV